MEKLTSLGETVISSGENIKLDTSIKRILSEKSILGWILAYTTEEFRGMEPADVVPYIEGDPRVAEVAVNPGSTNRIEGASQESRIEGEGLVTYDVRFNATSPKDGEKPAEYRLRINIEAQGRQHPGYDLETRGIVYCSRMISEQIGQNVIHEHYEDLQKVYSIWIVMNCSQESANTISEACWSYRDLAGSYQYQPRIDLERVVMIRLPKDDEWSKAKNKPERIHEMLSTLLSSMIKPEEKLKELKNEFDIPVTETLRKEVNGMCNYSDVVYDRGVDKGKEQTAIRMIRAGKLADQDISDYTGLPISRVKELREQEKLVTA